VLDPYAVQRRKPSSRRQDQSLPVVQNLYGSNGLSVLGAFRVGDDQVAWIW
jgi:hypothetical protein